MYSVKYSKNCYNKIGKTPLKVPRSVTSAQQRNSIPVIVNGVHYPSVSAAANDHKIVIATARNRLNDPRDTSWQYADPSKRRVSNVARPVVVGTTIYASVSQAAAKQGVSEKTVRKYISTLAEWQYLDQLSEAEKTQLVNLDASLLTEGSFKHGRPVVVGTVEYSSIAKAAKAYNICSKTVRKRINSPNFPDWEWA